MSEIEPREAFTRPKAWIVALGLASVVVVLGLGVAALSVSARELPGWGMPEQVSEVSAADVDALEIPPDDYDPPGTTASPHDPHTNSSAGPPTIQQSSGSVAHRVPSALQSRVSVSPVMPLGRLGIAFREASMRTGSSPSVSATRGGDGWVLSTLGSSAQAEGIARTLGFVEPSAPLPASDAEEAIPQLLQATVELNVRPRPGTEGAVAAILPAGTILTAFVGRIDGSDASYGERGTWSYVSVAEGVEGWSAGALVEPYVHCMPSYDAFARASGAGGFGPATQIIRDTAQLDGRTTPVFVAVVRDRASNSSHVYVFPSTSSCRLSPHAIHFSSSGYVEALVMFRLSPGGPSAVAVGVRDTWLPDPEGLLTWSVVAAGEQRALLSRRLASSVVSGHDPGQIRFGRRHRGSTNYSAVRIREHGSELDFVYDGTSLVPSVPSTL